MKSEATLVNAARQHDTVTDNGAVTHSTSLNNVVDLFFIAGASRNMSEESIEQMFESAYAEDPEMALRCLFWARDCRGGAGEKRFFNVVMKRILWTRKSISLYLIKQIPTFGCWKDVFALGKPEQNVIEWLAEGLNNSDRLLGKWYPRKGPWFTAMHRFLKRSPKELRKLLVTLSNGVVEQKMCAKQWGDISYSTVPSRAFNLYKKAFDKQDKSRFDMFIESLKKGEEKVNVGQLFPYELYKSFQKRDDAGIIDEQWKRLPDHVGEGSFLPICDVSGSMAMGYGRGSLTPMDISISLGVYLSERNKSVFKDAFITFSDNPKMEYLKGSATERFSQLSQGEWNMSTNLQASFALILRTAIENKLAPEDLPATLLIISDMEFNECAGRHTNFEAIQKQFEDSGYTMPKLAFWNVNGRQGNVPVSEDTKDVALISGASPAIVKSVLAGKDFTPVGIMLETLKNERYDSVVSMA